MEIEMNLAFERDEKPTLTSMAPALGSLSIAILLASLGTSITNVALPELATAFAATFQQTQWIVIAYLLAITISVVSAGRLGDLIGRRILLLAGLALFTTASLLCGLAQSLWFLIAARAVQGIGAAVLMATAMALVSDAIPSQKAGSAMGLLGAMSAVGTAVGPSLGGALIASFGWQAIFVVNLPLGAIAFYLAHQHLPSNRHAAKPVANTARAFDLPGTLLLAAALAAFSLAVTLGGAQPGLRNLILFGAAVALTLAFIIVETRSASPLVSLGTLREAGRGASLAANGLVSMVMMATLIVGPFYLSRVFDLSHAGVGIVLSIGPVISAISGIPAGRGVDRWGARAIVLLGLMIMLGGTIGLFALPGLLGLPGYIVAIAILTPGYALFQAANNTATMVGVGSSQRGLVSGMLNLSRNLGLITGASVMGAIFAFATASSEIGLAPPEAIAHGMQVTFITATVAILISLIIAIIGAGRNDRV